MADKKITDLAVASVINPTDVSVLVSSNTDYQYNFTLLLQFISANISTGAAISFGTAIPQDNAGKNGDVFLKTDTASFYQKLNGSWVSCYTITAGSSADGSMLYGIGIPGSSTGADNDSYIDTSSGKFYLKTSGSWSQVFAMANGPQGPQGIAGTNGANGTNGNTILHGSTNPSNSTDGVDGDFYINLSSYYFFGPKVSGVWPDGFSLFPAASIDPISVPFSASPANPWIITNWATDYFPAYGNAHFKIQFEGTNGNLTDQPNIVPTRVIDRTGTPFQTSISIDTTGWDFAGQLIIYYSNEPII